MAIWLNAGKQPMTKNMGNSFFIVYWIEQRNTLQNKKRIAGIKPLN
jgi:hypothetical protein